MTDQPLDIVDTMMKYDGTPESAKDILDRIITTYWDGNDVFIESENPTVRMEMGENQESALDLFSLKSSRYIVLQYDGTYESAEEIMTILRGEGHGGYIFERFFDLGWIPMVRAKDTGRLRSILEDDFVILTSGKRLFVVPQEKFLEMVKQTELLYD